MKSLNSLLVLAVVLIAIWVLASVTKFIAGALLNLLLVAAVVVLLVWGYRRIT